MGMYNTIWVNCPNCGEAIDFQSKSGSCILTDFDITNVPEEELAGIMGDSEQCDCGHVITVGDKESSTHVNATYLIR